MAATSIQWCDHSVSPIRARSKETGKVFHFCERVSPGCKNCYAATMAQRFGLPDYIKANRDKVEFFLDESKLQDVLKRRKPTRFFWEDCSDLFGSWVPDEWLDRCFATMALTPQHTHQCLTKRPGRMREYIGDWQTSGRITQIYTDMLTRGIITASDCYRAADVCERLGRDGFVEPWPLPNVWLGFSAENQKCFDERSDFIRPLSLAGWLTWCSAEPLLEHIQLSSCAGIKWLVAGGESGHGARPCDVAWIRSLVEQCKAAGVACFVKQLGAWPCADEPEASSGIFDKPLRDPKGGDIQEFPADLRIREFPITDVDR